MEGVIEGAERDAGAGNHGAGNHGAGNHEAGNHEAGKYGAGNHETGNQEAGNHGVENHGVRKYGTGKHEAGKYGAGARETAPEKCVIEGVVEHGQRLGRELGFPTANLAVPVDLPLSDGVYRSRVEVGGRRYDGMSNLGCNPTVGGGERRLETHIFDFSEELYGRFLRVELLEKIRDERRFATVEELQAQIAEDKGVVTALLKK